MVGSLLLAAAIVPAPVRAAEPESSCIACHMEEEDPALSAPVGEWRRSVHFDAEVSCDACHGGNPFEDDEELSMDADAAGFTGIPGRTEVPEFCGSCHEGVLAAYRASRARGQTVDGERLPTCTTCHMTDGHAISQPNSTEIFTAEGCETCDAERATLLRDTLGGTRARLTRTSGELNRLRAGIDTSVLDAEVAEIRERVVVIAHTYAPERIAEIAQVARERLVAVDSAAEELSREVTFRRRLGFGVVSFLLLMCAGVVGLHKAVSSGSTT